jgi:hypothetical protein
MLRESGLEVHESETMAKSTIFEAPNTPDVEAHAVISALGLPENFVPTFQPLAVLDDEARRKDIALRLLGGPPSDLTLVESSQTNSPDLEPVESPDSDSGSDSDSEESGDEFEAIDARALLQNSISEEERKKKLQQMKIEEAKSFAANAPKGTGTGAGVVVGRKSSIESVESNPGLKRSSEDDDEDEMSERVRGSRKSSVASTASTSSFISVGPSSKRVNKATEVDDDDQSTAYSPATTRENLLEKVNSKTSTISEGEEVEDSSKNNDDDSTISRKTMVVSDPIAETAKAEITDPTAIVSEETAEDKK